MSKAWPFYIVCDCSSSMWHRNLHQDGPTAYDAMVSSLLTLLDFAGEDVSVMQIAQVSILSFSDAAQTAMPLTALSPNMPIPNSLVRGTFTDFAALLRYMHRVLSEDIASLLRQGKQLKKPTVFIITDGIPETREGQTRHGIIQQSSVWRPELEALVDGLGDFSPAIVTMGFGGADENVLRTLSCSPGVAAIAEGYNSDAAALMRELLQAVLRSITSSASKEAFTFQVPPGMRVLT